MTRPTVSAPAPPAASPAPASARKTEIAGPVPEGLAGVVDRFLEVVARSAPEADPAETTAFQHAVERLRQQLRLPGGRDVAKAIDASLSACEDYLGESQKYASHREQELLEIIKILRKGATQMSGESTEFNAQVIASSERVLTLSRGDNLAELKQHIAAEVSELRRTAVAKQKRDQEMVTQLTERVETLQSNLIRAEAEASIDPLTRIANRGSFDRTLRQALAHAKRVKASLTVAMVDIDHFKQVNDAHGHPVGDRVILCVAQWLQKTVRKGDCVARYGGEEFAVILVGAKLDEVEPRIEKLLVDIAASTFEYESEGKVTPIRFTVSCGLAEFDASDSEADLIRRADEALYEAKRKGRNRVMSKKKSRLSRLFSG